MSECPSCGAIGRMVSDETIRAILTPEQALPLLATGRRFCSTPSCEVVYYADSGRVVTKGEVPVRVGIKEREDPVPLCYYVDFSVADVRRDLAETGRCTIPARVEPEVRSRRCSCNTRDPSGACCLGEVNRVVNQEAAAQARSGPDE